MISFIYLDIGGVLLDWTKAFEDATTKFGLKPADIGGVFDENHDSVTEGLLTPNDLWSKCIEKFSLKDASDFDFLESWVSDYRPIKKMHQLIIDIYPRYKIGLLSNIYKGMLPILLKKGLIPDIHYEQIILSCDVGMMKPDHDIYDLAQKKTNLNPNNILLIDDKQKYLDEAQKMQWNTFLFDHKAENASVNELRKFLIHGINI